jgi:hypothetical protein
VEGVARYTEARFLLDRRLQPNAQLVGDTRFANFARSRGKTLEQLPGLRGISSNYVYGLGVRIGLLLDRVAPDWKKRVTSHPKLLLGVVDDLCSAGKG